MSAPNVSYSYDKSKISGVSGFDHITVSFSCDADCSAFECRATKVGEDYGVGRGTLVASFSSTPSGVVRTFEIYDDYLVHGDGSYRISLFAQGEDGSWNDNENFVPSNYSSMKTADGKKFLARRTLSDD